MLTRRALMTGLVVAPAILRLGVHMPVRKIEKPVIDIAGGLLHPIDTWSNYICGPDSCYLIHFPVSGHYFIVDERNVVPVSQRTLLA